MSIRPVKRIIESKPTHGGRRREAAPRLRLRRYQASSIRSCCWTISATTVPTTTAPDSRGIRIAASRPSPTCWPASVDHGDSLGNQGVARRRRRAVDDSGQRHHAPGDAEGRRPGPHARLPALGQSAVVAEDDRAALPGHQGRRDSRGHRRRRHAGARRLRRLLGQARAGGGRRCRSALSRHLRAAGQAQDLHGRGRPARLRLYVRRLRLVPRRIASRSAC